jgi:hypothetical protein
VWLPRLGRRLDATLIRVADAATAPREVDPSSEGVLALRRVVQVTASFTVPADLRGIITPGGDAEVELP